MKNLGEAFYIFWNKIYRDRSCRLFGVTPITYIVKVLKRFIIEEFDKGFLPMSHDIYIYKELSL